MGSGYKISDSLDDFITKLEEMRKKVGGDARIRTSNPRILSRPFDRKELFGGIQLIEKDGRVTIRG